jgi:hypothetical protein
MGDALCESLLTGSHIGLRFFILSYDHRYIKYGLSSRTSFDHLGFQIKGFVMAFRLFDP